jgi:cardiolipin synthase
MSSVFGGRYLPNFISFSRLLLVIPIVWLLLNRQYLWALVLLIVAGLSDGLDGFLARYYDWHSHLGSYLDPLADKTLMVGCYLTLGWQGLLPSWLVILVILRDGVILLGSLAYRVVAGRLDMKPSLISKINTVLQIILILLVLWLQATGRMPTGVVDAVMVAVIITTVASGVHYVAHWTVLARREWSSSRQLDRE